MTTITLGLITFNGSKYIGNVLEQMAPLVDEIVVVDSFSTDDTIAIASQFGSKIFEKTFEGSFADLRNFAIDKATSQYILFMDCDETLEDPEKVLATNFEQEIYSLPRKTYLDGVYQEQWYPDVQHRIIKTNSLVQYESDLHEMPIGREDAVVLDTHIIHKKTVNEQHLNNIRYMKMNK
jgi:glycosyltransferase involved in cell wall biosynthesis